MIQDSVKIKKQLQKCIVQYQTLKISPIEYETKAINSFLSQIINITLIKENELLIRIEELRKNLKDASTPANRG